MNKNIVFILTILLFSINSQAQSNLEAKKIKTFHFGIEYFMPVIPTNSFNFVEEANFKRAVGKTTIKNYNALEVNAFASKSINPKNIIGFSLGYKQNAFDFNHLMRNPTSIENLTSSGTSFIRTISIRTHQIGFDYKRKLNDYLTVGLDIKYGKHLEYFERDRINDYIFNFYVSQYLSDDSDSFGVTRTFNTTYQSINFELSAYEKYSATHIVKDSKERRKLRQDFVPSVFLQYYANKNVYLSLALNLRFWSDRLIYEYKLNGQGTLYKEIIEEDTVLYHLKINNKSMYPKVGVGFSF